MFSLVYFYINLKRVTNERFIKNRFILFFMAIKKTLAGIILSGALLSGCGNNMYTPYEYNGKIEEDHVTFTKKCYFPLGDNNILTIIKKDGRTIKYIDNDGADLKLESIEITKNDQTIEYTKVSDIGKIEMKNRIYGEIGKKMVKIAQTQFDDYLEKIKTEKVRKDTSNAYWQKEIDKEFLKQIEENKEYLEENK